MQDTSRSWDIEAEGVGMDAHGGKEQIVGGVCREGARANTGRDTGILCGRKAPTVARLGGRICI